MLVSVNVLITWSRLGKCSGNAKRAKQDADLFPRKHLSSDQILWWPRRIISNTHYDGEGISETNIHKYYTSPLGGDITLLFHWQATFLEGMGRYYYRYHLRKKALSTPIFQLPVLHFPLPPLLSGYYWHGILPTLDR